MENKYKYLACSLLLAVLLFQPVNAQVLIGDTTTTNTVSDGAIFQLESSDKGLMLPRVALTSRTDNTTITPSLVEGLWVYNTASNGSGLDRVTPGFYFWDDTRWVRIYDEGYTVQFEQTVTERPQNTTQNYTIPGLDQNVTVPYTGTYEIHVSGYLAAANHLSSSEDGTVHGSYSLDIDGTRVAEANVTSNTKNTGGSFQALGRQCVIVHHVDLVAGTSYNIRVRARLWQHENINRNSLNVSSLCGGPFRGYAFFGICTSPYNGNLLGIDNAQDAYLTITLLRQY